MPPLGGEDVGRRAGGMGPGRAARGWAAPRGACSACPCVVWLRTELTSPGLCDVMHYVIITKM